MLNAVRMCHFLVGWPRVGLTLDCAAMLSDKMPAQNTEPTMSKDELHSPVDALLSYNELINLSLAFNARVDGLWQRMLYTHAAIVGVMVFFATTDDPFSAARLLVFFFYTLNIAITVAAFRESYSGLDAALRDLKAFRNSERNAHIQTWVLEQSYHRHARRRVLALGAVWMVIGYLLVYPFAIEMMFPPD